MARLCDLLDAMLHCMFGSRGTAVSAVKIDSYRERLTVRMAEAEREITVARRFAVDRTLRETERRKYALKARRLRALIAGGHQKLALLDSTRSAMDQMKDDEEFVLTMQRAKLPKVQKALEQNADKLGDVSDLIDELSGLVGAVDVDESELDDLAEAEVDTLLPAVPTTDPFRTRRKQPVAVSH
jgi:hypothetical protein